MALRLPLTTHAGVSIANAYVRLADPQVNWNDNSIRMSLQTFATKTARDTNKPEILDINWTSPINVTSTFERSASFDDVVTALYTKAKATIPELATATDA